MPMRIESHYDGRRAWTTRGRRMAEDGLRTALEHTLGVAQQLAPLREGTLSRTGTVTTEGLNGAISFDTPYAVRQHEELSWRHLPGRQAKYLETPMNTERETMLALMAVPLRRWLRG